MSAAAARASTERGVPATIVGGVLIILAAGGLLVRRAGARVDKRALSSAPQAVAVAVAKHASYRASRTYGGTFESWVEAGVGPQYLSAYVETVLVRPGARVQRGAVLASLDCRSASSAAQAARFEARATAAEQRAIADEAARVQTMREGAFVSPDEAEQALARSQAREAELAEREATAARGDLSVDDCVLRSPFDGEVSERAYDPGAFVRPGMAILTVVDRSTVRLVADAPETDFGVLAPGTPVLVHVYATNQDRKGTISRRAPGTDPDGRTVRFEVDIPDPERDIPTNTTGEVHIDAGEPQPATEVPLYAASVRSGDASLWLVEGDEVRRRSFAVKGEIGGSLFVDQALPAGARIVLEGRALLQDGDRVVALTSPTRAPEGGSPR